MTTKQGISVTDTLSIEGHFALSVLAYKAQLSPPPASTGNKELRLATKLLHVPTGAFPRRAGRATPMFSAVAQSSPELARGDILKGSAALPALDQLFMTNKPLTSRFFLRDDAHKM